MANRINCARFMPTCTTRIRITEQSSIKVFTLEDTEDVFLSHKCTNALQARAVLLTLKYVQSFSHRDTAHPKQVGKLRLGWQLGPLGIITDLNIRLN